MNEKTSMQLIRFKLVSMVLLLVFTNLPLAHAQKDWSQTDWQRIVNRGSPEGPPRQGEIICIGSSHMALWRSVGQDLRPLQVYNFGIGGTTMKDAADAFAKHLVIPYKPRAVILYEGSNDIARDTAPEQILEHFRDFYRQVREAIPEARLYVLGIVPSPGRRFEKWDTIRLANATLKKECEQYPWLTFIDTTSGLIGKDGQPRAECFIPKDIHMNAKGYEVWAAAVAPVVLEAEQVHHSED